MSVTTKYLDQLRYKLLKEAGISYQGIGLITSVNALGAKPPVSSKEEAWLWLRSIWADRASRGLLPVDPGKRSHKTRLPRVTRATPGVEFYQSPEWRKLRHDVLLSLDGRCCLCGRAPRIHGVMLHVDHIIPRSVDPTLELTFSNLQVLCEDCNLGKSNRDSTDWRPT